MNRFLASFAAVAVIAGAASANDTMDAMIGATVVYSYDGGATVEASYDADGTYSTDSVGGGSWTMSGDELCITTDDGASGCTELEAGHGAGDSWEATDAFGNPVTISIE